MADVNHNKQTEKDTYLSHRRICVLRHKDACQGETNICASEIRNLPVNVAEHQSLGGQARDNVFPV